jgi:hypothetical protein
MARSRVGIRWIVPAKIRASCTAPADNTKESRMSAAQDIKAQDRANATPHACGSKRNEHAFDWNSYGQARVIPIAATHHTIMRAPHVEQVAGILGQVRAGA